MVQKFYASKLYAILAPLKAYMLLVVLFSFFLNLLMLTPIFYIRSVLDHAISHRSEPTLLVLTIIMLFLMTGIGFLWWARTQIAQRAGVKMYALLAPDIFDTGYKRSVYAPAGEASIEMLQELGQLKDFIGSQAFLSLFDLVFTPIYIVVMFMFHLYFGLMALFGLAVMVCLSILNEKLNRSKVEMANREEKLATGFARRNYANAGVIDAMGITADIKRSWLEQSGRSLKLLLSAGESEGVLAAASRTFRLALQSLTLGLGAYLVINDQISPGTIIAGTLLLGRALAPVDSFIGSWTKIVFTRGSLARLVDLYEKMPPKAEKTLLPRPRGKLSLENAVVGVPGVREAIIRGVSFTLNSGGHLGIVGPSGSGKSTLARALLGLWPCTRGHVRLDGADLFYWDRTFLGPYIGYLPQDLEMFEGTVSENIGRMGRWSSEDVVAAAKLSGTHEMILRLPQGYDTRLGPGGSIVSEGQRQRLGLARAVYGNPKFIVLDEPNTYLDAEGELALLATIKRLKAIGITLVVISHSVRVLSELDYLLVLKRGRIANFGAPDEVLTEYRQESSAEGEPRLTDRPTAPGLPSARTDVEESSNAD